MCAVLSYSRTERCMKLVYTIRWLSHPTLNVLYNSFWDDSEHAFLSCKVDFFCAIDFVMINVLTMLHDFGVDTKVTRS